jgi:hypothetical protein
VTYSIRQADAIVSLMRQEDPRHKARVGAGRMTKSELTPHRNSFELTPHRNSFELTPHRNSFELTLHRNSFESAKLHLVL